MAGCHWRLQVFLQTRVLRKAGRLFYSHSQPVVQHRRSITSLCTSGYQNSCFLQNGWKPGWLKTNSLLSEQTNSRFLHSSFKVLSQDNSKGQNQGNHSTVSSIDSETSANATPSDGNKEESVPEEKLTVIQRFKKTYKEHGKVLVSVHVVTSAVWFGSFFYAAKVGVDVIPFMEWLGLSEKIVGPFRSSSLGDVALAYLMYKLATPARYTVTLTGTNYAIKYLRKRGVMQPVDKSSSLRSLAKDSKTELQQKRVDLKHKTDQFETKLKKQQTEVKDRFLKLKESRTKMKDRLLKFRSKLKYKKNKSVGSRKGQRPPRSKK